MKRTKDLKRKYARMKKDQLIETIFELSGQIAKKKTPPDEEANELTMLRSLYNNLTVAAFRSTPDGEILLVNQAMLQMYGYKDFEEFLQVPVLDFYVFRKDREKMIRKLQKDHRINNYVTREKKKNGEHIWVKTDYIGLFDEEGKLRYIDGIAEDITERKMNHEALQERERKLRIMYENSADVIWSMDEKLNFIEVSPAVEKMLKYKPDEVIGKSFVDFFTMDSVKRARDIIRKKSMFPDDVELRYNEYEMVDKEGKIVPVEVSSSSIVGEDGKLVGFSGITRDVSNIRKAESELRKSEEKYRKLTETARDIICIHDLDGYIKYLNKAGLDFIGMKEEDVVGMNVLEFISETNKKTVYDRQKKRLLDDQKIFLYESEFMNREGNSIPVEVSSSVLEREHEKFDILIVARDITERKKAEIKLKNSSRELQETVEARTRELKLQKDQMERSQKALTFLLEDVNESREEMAEINKKLEDANKELEAFSYSVSHDLKAPLRALDGFSQILLEDYEDKLDDDAKRYLNLIRENSQRMGLLIQDLLDFSRVGRYEVRIQEVDMKKMVKEVKNDVLEAFGAKDLECIIHDLPATRTDKTMIRQVWQNLLSNAVKFSRNKEDARVEIKAEVKKGKVRYYVQDNGIGFDMRYKPKLFNVFQRLHTQEEFEGTGVGLAIVKRIIKRLGGEVDASGKTGKGASFLFELPLK